MSISGNTKNPTGLDRLTRKLMDHAAGVESSAVARRLFFGGDVTAELVPDLAIVDTSGIDPDVYGSSNTLYPTIASVVSSALDPEVAAGSEENIWASIRAAHAATLNLGVVVGAVPPVNIVASLNINQPENIAAYLITAYSSISNIGATLTQVGAYSEFTALLRSLSSSYSNILAEIEVKNPGNLGAFLYGYAVADLSASLVTERHSSIKGILWGRVVAAVSNFGGYLRQEDSGVKDMPVSGLKAVVRTHTSDKSINLQKVSKIFHENRFLFGTKSKGLVSFVIEPIYGIFPDLHAEIFAQQYFRASIGAVIRPASPGVSDVSASAIAVSPHIKMTKVILSPYPLRDLAASLTQRGGYLPLSATVKGIFSGATGTAVDAGYTTTAASHVFILGTSKGLLIPQQNVPTIRTTIFNNNHPMPDLRAYLRAWVVADIGASIKVYFFSNLLSTLTPIGPDKYKDLRAQVEPAYISDLLASLASAGAYSGINASLSPFGAIASLPASIVAFINPLSYNTIAVSTKPFIDMGALINYGTIMPCAPQSRIVSISAFIRAFEGGEADNASNLGASLNSLRQTSGMPAEIIGRKLTRIRILTLNFRASTRASTSLASSAVPVHSSYSGMAASISGLSHEINLPATISPVRYALNSVLFTAKENAVNLNNPDNFKDIMLSFRSKVSSYVYESVGQAVYATDRGTWVIDLRTVERQESFFDRDPDSQERALDDAEEFYSLDEAIRNAISMICDGVQRDFGASIYAAGGASSISAYMDITPIDRFTNLRGKLVSVANVPDLSASINTGPGSSGHASLMTLATPGGAGVQAALSASISPQVSVSISAEVVAV